MSTGRELALERARKVRSILLKHGVPEVSIELQIGRPGSGDEWNLCNPIFVLSHHIASRPTPSNPTPGLSLVKRGRSDLPGPLCNGTAGVDLVYRIICMGYANHSGEGGSLTVQGPLGSYTIPRDVGRPYIWGTEYEGGYDEAVWDKTYTNERTGKSMTFREFMGRCNSGLVEAIWAINGKGEVPKAGMDLSSYHGEHKTWAGARKIDRLGYDTGEGRAEIKKWADKLVPTVVPPQPELKTVSLSNMKKAAKGRVSRPLPGVKRVQRALNENLPNRRPLDINGIWDERVTTRYRRFQKKIGVKPQFQDGMPGRHDLTVLGEGRFRVRD